MTHQAFVYGYAAGDFGFVPACLRPEILLALFCSRVVAKTFAKVPRNSLVVK